MMVVPAVNPLTTPVPAIVATVVLLLLHTPPVVASVNGVVWPMHRIVVPVIADGDALMVTIFVTVQPDPKE